MKIKLDLPFSKDWRYGYILVNSEKRKIVILYKNDKTRTTISYARYLMTCKIGEYLPKNLEVDHIDNNKTNDSIENLQILPARENKRKSSATGQTMVKFVCPVCGIKFELSLSRSHKKNPCCSKKCGNIKMIETQRVNRLMVKRSHL